MNPNGQMLASAERVCKSKWLFFGVSLRTHRLQQNEIMAMGSSDKSSSELLPSCLRTRDPWKVIREVNMSQIADNGKGMIIIYKVTAYLHRAASTLYNLLDLHFRGELH